MANATEECEVRCPYLGGGPGLVGKRCFASQTYVLLKSELSGILSTTGRRFKSEVDFVKMTF